MEKRGRFRPHERLALVVALVLVAAACGTRLADEEFLALQGDTEGGLVVTDGTTVTDDAGGPAPVDGPGSDGVSGPGAVSDGTGTNGPGSSGGTGGAGDPGTGGTGGGGTGGGTGGGGGGGPANTASDVGISPDSIKVGNIVSRGGALGPEAFTPMFFGARAYFESLNEKGGVNGRKIQFISCDDKENPAQNLQCASDLIDGQKVFALVGFASVAYPAASFVDEKGVPDIGGQPVGDAFWTWPHLYTVLGAEGYPRDGNPGYEGQLWGQTNTYRFFAQQLGVKRAAVFFYSIAASANAAELFERGLAREGIDVVFKPNNGAGRNPADPSYDTDVLQMQRANADNIWNALDIAGFQKLCQAMDRFGVTVEANVSTIQGWSQKIGDDFSSPCRNNIYANGESRPYSETSHPAIAEFRAAMDKFNPGVRLHQWNVEGWVAGMLFTDGVRTMGATPTRKGLLEWLDAQRNYTANGIMAGVDWRRSGIDFGNESLENCISVVRWDEEKRTMAAVSDIFTCDQTTHFNYDPAGDQS